MKSIKALLLLLVLLLSACAATPSSIKESEDDQSWNAPDYSVGSNIPHHANSRTETLSDQAQQELANQILHGNPARVNK
ncbi:hypothetical protein [Chromobacterium sp. ASV23]|nr:hypothetical protein [Chromobacterium sp. ASV23]